MLTCAPIRAPKSLNTPRRQPKQGRGLKLTNQRPRLHITLRTCSVVEYLRAARFERASVGNVELLSRMRSAGWLQTGRPRLRRSSSELLQLIMYS
jgi:hypothetical protein